MTVSSRTAAPSKALFRDLTCRSCLNVLLDPFAQKYCLHCGDAVLVNQCTCGRPVPHKSDGSLYNHCSTCGAGTDDLENKRPKIRLWAEEDLDIKCRCPCAGKTCTGKNATNDTDSQPPSKQQQFNYQQTPIFAKKRKRAKIKSNKENESSQSEAEPQETMAVYQPDPTRSEQGDTIHVEQLNNAGTSQIEMNVDLGGLEDNEGPTSIPRQRGSIARGPRYSTQEKVHRLIYRLQKKTSHLPERIPPTEKKSRPARVCRLCSQRGQQLTGRSIRRDSRWQCCKCKIALCVDCFEQYHEENVFAK